MKIAILYVVLGNYTVFWKDFYESCEKFFINNMQKDYFVFTDADFINYETESNVNKIYQQSREWPFNTLMRFEMFLSQEEKLKGYDYVFFFNANMKFMAPITHEILPTAEEGNLVMGEHPGFYNKQINDFTYDRNPNSLAYIPYGQGKHYVQGCLNGGTSDAYLELCRVCNDNINKDLENDVIALWHDESHLNKYVLDKNYKLLPPNYLYPEGWNLKEYKNKVKILQVDKSNPRYGGIDNLRGLKKSNNNSQEFIPIAYAPDNKYYKLAIVSMISILENTKSNIEFIIMYSKLSETAINNINTLLKYKNCKISYLYIDEKIFNNFPLSTWVTVQTWFRTKIADLRPDLNKIIYLDCDTLVNGNISEFYNINLSNKLAATVTDVWSVKQHIKRLNMKSKKYFNAGVLLINAKKWRDVGLFEKIKKYAIENFNNLECSDQDVLNKIIDLEKIELPQKYDYMETWWHNYYNEYEGIDKYYYKKAKGSALIIHFTGNKPSSYECFNSYKRLWWDYALKSSISEELKESFLKERDNIYKIKRVKQIKQLKYFLKYKLSIGKRRKKYKSLYKEALNNTKNIYRYEKAYRQIKDKFKKD